MSGAEMYAENILEHFKRPRNQGVLKDADATARVANPLCGDILSFSARLNGGTIEEIGFVGEGCAISQAAASMLTDFIKGKSFQEIAAIDKEDVFRLLGVKLSAARIKCALLALDGVRELINGRAFGHADDDL